MEQKSILRGSVSEVSKTVLSTKLLTTAQKELLLNSGIGLVSYNAIHILYSTVDELEINSFGYFIFTSQHAVCATEKILPKNLNCFCVGEKTRMLLEENGHKIVETAENAKDLAKMITRKYSNDRFLFFCGNLRREELPAILKTHNIFLEEKTVYHTTKNVRKYNRIFDGILFFSPSAVQSYVAENTFEESVAFCIGNTTASEVRKHTNNIITANKPTIENVITQVVKKFKLF